MDAMEKLGRYVLLERVGCGGTAEVFRAAAVGTSGFARPVAIKRVLAHLSGDVAFTTMLVDEARIASMLIHPSIVQVLDLGRHAGTYFIAMEYVSGATLDTLLRRAAADRTALPPGFIVYVATQVARALHYAHCRTSPYGEPLKIIHRDVTPANVMLGFDGTVKLADFGVARAEERLAATTMAGIVKGKPSYMSPEQAAGDEIDHRLDVYALGAVLYELFALRPLRSARSDLHLLKVALSGEYTPLAALGLALPARMDALINRALAPFPDGRFADAQAMAVELETVAHEHGWAGNPALVGDTLRRILPDMYSREQLAVSYYQALVDQLAAADSVDVPLVLSRFATAETVVRAPPIDAPPASIAAEEDLPFVDAEVIESTPPRRRAPLLAALGAVVAATGLVMLAQSSGGEGPAALEEVGANATTGAPLIVPALPAVAVEAPAPSTEVPVTQKTPRRVSSKPGTLNIWTSPWGRIYVDGKDTGRFSPAANIELRPGRHFVKVVNTDTGLSSTFSVQVAPGGVQSIKRRLR